MFQSLPHEYVSVDNLPKVAKHGGKPVIYWIVQVAICEITKFWDVELVCLSCDLSNTATNKVYACVVDMEDNLVRKKDGGFDRDEYLQHPERYASTFSVKVGCCFFSDGHGKC